MPHVRKGLRAAALILWPLFLAPVGVGGCRGRQGGAPAGPAAGQPPATPAQPAGGAPAAPPPQPAAGEWELPRGLPVLRARAVGGKQVYKATAGTDGKPTWTLVGPEAELREVRNNRIGGEVVIRHYRGAGGPVWECADGSVAMGRKVHERPSPNAGAIPELQLEARPAGAAGFLSNVTLIERLNTFGGTPPADPGPQDVRAGLEIKVPYSADYVFYAPAE